MINMQVIVNGILAGSFYALVSIGLSLVFGVMKVVNFTHGVFYTLGSYMTVLIYYQLGLNPFIAFLLSPISVFLMGVFIDRLTVEPVRKSPETAMIITFALALFLEQVIMLVWGPFYITLPAYYTGVLEIVGLYFEYQRLVALGLTILILIGLWIFLRKSRLGKAVRMSAQDEKAAMILGINVNRVYLLTFGLSAYLAACAGCFFATLYPISPSMGWMIALIAFSVTIFGGMGSSIGVLVASLMLGIAESLTSYYIAPHWKMIVFFLTVIFVLLFRPSGLFGKAITRA